MDPYCRAWLIKCTVTVTIVTLLPAFETAIRKAGFSIVVSLSGELDQPELLQRADAVVEPDFLDDLAVFQL